MSGITHTTSATGVDSGDGKISKNAWNETHTLSDIVDLPTAETDDTLVLAPNGIGGVEFRAESGGTTQFDEDAPSYRLPASGTFTRIAEKDPGTGFDAFIRLSGNSIAVSAGDGTDGGSVDITGSAFAKAVVISVSDSGGADFSSVDVEPTGIDLFTGGRITMEGLALVVPRLSADPSGATAGDIYFNNSSNKHRAYDGTTWHNLY